MAFLPRGGTCRDSSWKPPHVLAGWTESRQRQRHQRARKVRADATDLHDDVLLALVHVGHHPVLAGGRKLDARQDLARPLVAGMELQRGVGEKLRAAATERPGLDQKITHDHLDR